MNDRIAIRLLPLLLAAASAASAATTMNVAPYNVSGRVV